MWIPFAARKPEGCTPEAAEPPSPPRKKRRRAATTMEYVVMISFILLVIIAAVQGFGFSVGKLFTAAAAATSKAQPPEQVTPADHGSGSSRRSSTPARQ